MMRIDDLIRSLEHRGDMRADWWIRMQDAIKTQNRERVLAMLTQHTADFDFETQFKIIADAMIQP